MRLYEFWKNNKTDILKHIDNIDMFFDPQDDKTKLWNQFDNVINLCGDWKLQYNSFLTSAFIVNEFQKFTYIYKTLGETIKQLKEEGVNVSLNDLNISYLENNTGYRGFDLRNQDGIFQKNTDKGKNLTIINLSAKINQLMGVDFPKLFWNTAQTIRRELLTFEGV